MRIELWGNIAPVHLKQVKLLELEQAIHISSYLNKDKSIIKLNNCDVMFLPLESSKNGQQPLFIPGKLFDYLKIGKPVLTLSEPCDSSEILIEAGIGIQIDPKATDLVAQQLILLINRKNELNKIYRPNLKFIRQFDSKSLTQKLTNLLDEL